MKVKNANGFNVSSANESFNNRQKNIFSQLDLIEKESKNLLQNAIELMDTNDKIDQNLVNEDFNYIAKPRHFRGKESIFKKPHSPFNQRLQFSKIPDFKKNPHKWTKYTLSDITAEDMSEKSNTSAAMSFLEDMENRKQVEVNEEKLSGERIKFNKSKSHKTDADTKESKTIFVSSKLIMPEYVVGKSPKPTRGKKTKPEQSGKEVKLSHLNFEDEVL
ncbi:protein TSSC4 [Agrilus planipennis]|uniref:U5 small nuclear ribonucleoprotein TSSC4 n=1 Tax=Agrilus planipennis TaxID=224129 RepID=A0A1W4XEV5_AGRPL|nr:protein TSSC4 [Agrilus planipennis]